MEFLQRAWYENARWLHGLVPIERLFSHLAKRRRERLSREAWTAPVPVVVVGNISVGGTGKSPLVIALIEHLRTQGFTPGVVSRGYGAKPPAWPYLVRATDQPAVAGDEPLMIVQRTGVPLVIAPDRVAACQHLLQQTACDVIISDDGLQHYRLGRNIEIAVIDGSRGLGNGRCLPAGPLREPPARLAEVDWVIINTGETAGFTYPNAVTMQLSAQQLRRVRTQEAVELSVLEDCSVNAVAGIGNPERFFKTLRALRIRPIRHVFADHHAFTLKDITFGDALPVIMTEKDAVKCRTLTDSDRYYYLPVTAQLPASFLAALVAQLNDERHRSDGQKVT